MQELLNREKITRKILIVDDEFIERAILAKMLDGLYEIVYAEDGVKALEIIRRDKLKLSLVLMDLYMPELDGHSVLKIMQADSELRRIPVIVLTAEENAEVKSLQAGAADFIKKPCNQPDVVRARVKHSIELAEDSIIIHQTERDTLTGLFNKEFFFQYGKLLENKRDHAPMDAIILDINRFRIVNELYGQNYGDEVLRKIGGTIHKLVNEVGGLACRVNNDIFFIYLPHRNDITAKIQEYISMIEDTLENKKITFRIGIYRDSSHAGEKFEMERKFDFAKLACRKLRNTYTTRFNFYNEELRKKEIHSEQLINDIDKAISEKQLKVFYQPKYNISGDKPVLTSAEALVRWVHPEFGFINPGDFIPLFENNGLIQKLDIYVWKEAAAQIKSWREKFGVYLPVSVNVSRVDIFDPMFSEILSGIIKENEIEPEKLLLEITESAYVDNAGQIIDSVSRLRELGFKVEMDDFGCGYSSLNMLTALPLDALKLDMAIVKDICVNQKAYRLVAIILEIAKILEVPAIAEGVETIEQLNLLKEIGCDIVQGYYFSKPLPADEFEKFFS